MYSVPHVRNVCVYVLCADELFCVGCVGPWTHVVGVTRQILWLRWVVQPGEFSGYIVYGRA